MMATCLAVAKVRDPRVSFSPPSEVAELLTLFAFGSVAIALVIGGLGEGHRVRQAARPRVAHERKPVRCQSVLMNPSGPTSPPAPPSPSPSNSTPSSRATSTCSSRPTSR